MAVDQQSVRIHWPQWLALAGALAALSVVGATLALALTGPASDSPVTDPAPAAATGSIPGGPPLGVVAAEPSPSPTSTPAPVSTPTPSPDDPDGEPTPEDVAVGGDEPMGPLPPSNAPTLPENVNASDKFLALRDSLAQEIDSYSAQVGGIDVAVAVTDLQSGATTSVNGNVPHRTGCTINMFALLAAVGEFEAGRADPWSVASNIRVGIGGSYPPEVRRFLQTVFPSYQAGVDRAQELMSSWGMARSAFYQVPYYQVGNKINQLTSLDVNLVLGKLYRNELFSPEWTDYTLARLREVNWGLNYMLPGQLPATATVAHKIGFYADFDGWVNNDAGIVTFTGADGKQKAYAITYLSQQAATEHTGYSFGARLSRIVWDWFAAKYGVGAQPSPTGPAPAEPTATPTPTTPPPEPTPTPTQAPEPTATPTPKPTATPTPEPTSTPTPTPSPTPTSTATPTASPTATATPE